LVVLISGSPGCVCAFHTKFLVPTNEIAVIIANETTGEKARFHKNLESVANPQNREALVCFGDDLGHDRRMRGDCPTPEIVAVAKATGEHKCVHSLKIVGAVPQWHGVSAR
jgi:hypothetical protein